MPIRNGRLSVELPGAVGWLTALGVALLAFALYRSTMLPGVDLGDQIGWSGFGRCAKPVRPPLPSPVPGLDRQLDAERTHITDLVCHALIAAHRLDVRERRDSV